MRSTSPDQCTAATVRLSGDTPKRTRLSIAIVSPDRPGCGRWRRRGASQRVVRLAGSTIVAPSGVSSRADRLVARGPRSTAVSTRASGAATTDPTTAASDRSRARPDRDVAVPANAQVVGRDRDAHLPGTPVSVRSTCRVAGSEIVMSAASQDRDRTRVALMLDTHGVAPGPAWSVDASPSRFITGVRSTAAPFRESATIAIAPSARRRRRKSRCAGLRPVRDGQRAEARRVDDVGPLGIDRDRRHEELVGRAMESRSAPGRQPCRAPAHRSARSPGRCRTHGGSRCRRLDHELPGRSGVTAEHGLVGSHSSILRSVRRWPCRRS